MHRKMISNCSITHRPGLISLMIREVNMGLSDQTRYHRPIPFFFLPAKQNYKLSKEAGDNDTENMVLGRQRWWDYLTKIKISCH